MTPASLQQGLQRLADSYVLFVAALIPIELLTLHSVEPAAHDRRTTRREQLLFNLRRLQLVFGVVGALPGEPLRRPAGVGRLNVLLAERKRAAGGALERRELVREQLTGG